MAGRIFQGCFKQFCQLHYLILMIFGALLLSLSSYGLYYIYNSNVQSQVNLLNVVFIIGILSGIICCVDAQILFSAQQNNRKCCFFIGSTLILCFSVLFIIAGAVLINYGYVINNKIFTATCKPSYFKIDNLMYKLNNIYTNAQSLSGKGLYCTSSSCQCALSNTQANLIKNNLKYNGTIYTNGKAKTLSDCKTLQASISKNYPYMNIWKTLFNIMETSLNCTGICDKQLGLYMFSDVSKSPALKSCKIGLGNLLQKKMNWMGALSIVSGIYLLIMIICCGYYACGCDNRHTTTIIKEKSQIIVKQQTNEEKPILEQELVNKNHKIKQESIRQQELIDNNEEKVEPMNKQENPQINKESIEYEKHNNEEKPLIENVLNREKLEENKRSKEEDRKRHVQEKKIEEEKENKRINEEKEKKRINEGKEKKRIKEEEEEERKIEDETDKTQVTDTIIEDPYLEITTQEDQCSSIHESQKIKMLLMNDIVRYGQETKKFKELFSKLELDNVVEKVLAKSTAVKFEKFESWKNVFIDSLNKINLINVSGIIEVINKDLEKMINQDENRCIFQGRDFNEKYEGNSSYFSIYISIIKKEENYEINYCYKVLTQKEKEDSETNEDILQQSEFKKSLSSAMRLDALKEFQNEVL